MRIRTFLKPLSFVPAILLMYMIFTFSAQEGDVSSQYSYKASTMIVRSADYIFDLELEDWQVDNYAVRIHGVTRKLAHMGEYFLLAIAVSFPLYVYGLHGIWLMLLAGFICIGYAFGDEYHQSMVAGRSAQYKDVAIDSVGVLLGIILVRIIGWTGRHTIFRPVKKDGYSRKERKRMQREQEWYEDEMRERQARAELERRRRMREENRKNKSNRNISSDHDSRYDDRYDERYDDRHDERYSERYDDRRDERYDERYDDRRDERYNEHYDDRRDKRYNERYDDRRDERYDDRYDRYDERYDGYDERYPEDYDDDYYYDEPDDDSSDALADDMPFSSLLRGGHADRDRSDRR